MKRIAIIPGDGVGPEVVRESRKILEHIASMDPAVEFSFDDFPWSAESYLKSGTMMPPDGLDILDSYDALLFGAIGSPSVPDHITLRELLLKIRGGFDQYVNLRPVRLLEGISSPLVGATKRDIDMIFVREGTEGEYAGVGARLYPGSDREVALQTAVFSRHGTERVIRWAFELAAREGRRSRASVRATRSTTRRCSGMRSSTKWPLSTRPFRRSACWSMLRRCSW